MRIAARREDADDGPLAVSQADAAADFEPLELRFRASSDDHLSQAGLKHAAFDDRKLRAHGHVLGGDASHGDPGPRPILLTQQIDGRQHLARCGGISRRSSRDTGRVLDGNDGTHCQAACDFGPRAGPQDDGAIGPAAVDERLRETLRHAERPNHDPDHSRDADHDHTRAAEPARYAVEIHRGDRADLL